MHYNYQMCQALFPNGGETYTYSELRNWLINNCGVSAYHAVRIVGAGVKYGYYTVASYSKQSGIGEAVFVR